MADSGFRFRRSWTAMHRRSRELMMILKGLASTDHPILAHIIPIRRCNLSCAYCNEYDDVSKPVPLSVMLESIARIRKHRIMAGMITNGYLLTADRIRRLNQAGLEHLQISIDNVTPDDVSKKSLKVLDK